jgi:hypothetical protein
VPETPGRISALTVPETDASDVLVGGQRGAERGWATGWLSSDRVVVAGLTALALLLRVPNLGRAYWIDETISVGIASHRLGQIPGLLRHDGSPPLWYYLLHWWIEAFGTSPDATHTLSLIVSLAAVPAGYWAGRELFDRRAGIAAAALMATNPYLNWYSTETRMYTLVILISIFACAFAWRAASDRRPLDAVAASVAFAALIYTHYWGLYLAAATGGVLVVVAWRRSDRQLARWTFGCGAAVVVLLAPWLPSFLYQASNTGDPWAVPPGIGDFFADPSTAIGGTAGILIAPLLVFGSWWCWRLVKPSAQVQSRLLALVALTATAGGFLASEWKPSWTVRYLAVIVAPYLLAAAGALAGSARGKAVLWAACGSLAVWSVIGTLIPNPNNTYAKDNMAAIAKAVASRLAPGDVVISTQTEQLPVAHFYLPAGMTYLNPMGPVSDPSVVDWVHIVARLTVAQPCEAIGPTLDSLPVGADVLLLNPARKLGASGSAWAQAVAHQEQAVTAFVAADPALSEVATYAENLHPQPYAPVRGTLFEKTSNKLSCS